MNDLVANCPRCRSQSITFDVLQLSPYRQEYRWQLWYEAFAVCKHCNRATIFLLSDLNPDSATTLSGKGLSGVPGSLNNYVNNEGYVSIADLSAEPPPDHLPPEIDGVFREGAKCLAIGCNNAAGTMFRLCIDLATREMLPTAEGEPSARTRRNLGLRLPWLFNNGHLPETIRELSTCVREDGNDGAHAGTLTKEDATDLLDFTFILLERLYTEPKRLELAAKRREDRRRQAEDD